MTPDQKARLITILVITAWSCLCIAIGYIKGVAGGSFDAGFAEGFAEGRRFERRARRQP